MKSLLAWVLALAASSSHPIIVDAMIPVLSQNDLMHGTGLSDAFQCGVFYLEMPQECKEHVGDALEFCYWFPGDDNIKRYTDGKFGGYHDREHDQIESFYVERGDWNRVLPAGIHQLALEMGRLANALLSVALTNSHIPNELWSEGTGLLTEDRGQYHFSFNHYRSEKNAVGIKPHQDFGFVSILYVEKAGLQVLYKGKWVEVPPLADHFVVIFGKAFEILLDDTSVVSGAWHRVPQLAEERGSFAITCDSEEHQAVKRYKRETNQLEAVYECYQDYLTDCFKQTYSAARAISKRPRPLALR